MRDNIDFDGLDIHVGELLFGVLVSRFDNLFDITFQTFDEMFEHCCSPREGHILVQMSSGINRTVLDGLVYYSGKGCCEVTGKNFGAEENFGSQKPFVSHIDGKLFAGSAVFVLVHTKTIVTFLCCVVFNVFLHQIWANVAIHLLDSFGNIESNLRREIFSSVAKNLNHKIGDISAGKRDVLDATADHITLKNRNDVGDTITTVNNGTTDGSVLPSILLGE
mmetsp:Transcript_472/g.653  ORF Transcript_472/g.653 Transcript_472/m.653 type:complete len:221 (+) Transcript_472:364-1026(+)